jgi:signal transduction histidine kinase
MVGRVSSQDPPPGVNDDALPTLAEVRDRLAQEVPCGHGDDDSARRQWWAALATLQEDFLLPTPAAGGLWLAAPLPALYEPLLLQRLQGWVWAPPTLETLMPVAPGRLPAGGVAAAASVAGFERLALRESDGTDPLLLLITPELQVGMALHGPPQARQLVMRFDPPTLSAALTLIDRRLHQEAPGAAQRLHALLQELGPLRSDDTVAQRFWPRLSERLAAMAPSVTLQPLVHGGREGRTRGLSSELALLEALTHEVRTPLATIRTLIRSLLRRQDLPAVVRQRLEQIDGECSEQIDRFGLIFHAAELQRHQGDQSPTPNSLARTDLSSLLHQLEPIWQRQLERRGLRLELRIAPELPAVLSDPSRLETMLGGLMDRYSRSLTAGACIQLSLRPAGARLKLQLSQEGESRSPPGSGVEPAATGGSRAVGPVLSWDPTTGSLQLSRQATQQLFRSLGGRLTERSGSALTVFFPVA